ncbi:MAG: GntR family transcriptional regulator [Ruminococcaceae bacterium]|nr:GntR family transcriptional regulator [Oscillospiraceae bacterium]
MLDENSAVPLYRQLQDIFQNNIESGVWPAEEKLPTESELCEQYGVSRMTVRLALEGLKIQGLIYRKQGKGSFVLQPKVEQELSSFYSFGNNMAHLGHTITNKLISFERLTCPAAAAALRLPETEALFCVQRLRCADNTPFALEKSYIPCAVCPNLTGDIIIEKGLYNALHFLVGIMPDTAKESFEAVLINKNQAEALETAGNQPALHVERVTGAGGVLVEYCDSIVRGDRLKYNIVLR